MRGIASDVRPLTGVARRAAPVVNATLSGERSLARTRCAILPAPSCGAMAERKRLARRAGIEKCVKVTPVHFDVKMAAGVPSRAAPVQDAAAGERTFRKRQWGVAPPAAAARREMARVYSARRTDLEDSSKPRPKRIKVADVDVDVKTAIFASDNKMSVDHAQEILKKRMAVELDALRHLVKKAKLLYEARPEAHVVAVDRAPSAKRRKMSPLVEQIDARRMSPEEGEIIAVVPEEDDECIDICGGVSPVAIRDASPLVSLEKADETGTSPGSIRRNSWRSSTKRRKTSPLFDQVDALHMSPAAESKINIVPEEQDEYVDICGGVSPVVIRDATPLELASEACSSSSDSGSSSSSDSDSGSDSDEDVESPTPTAVPPKENNSPAPPPPAGNVTSAPPPPPEPMQSTEPESNSDESASSPAPSPVLPKKIDSPVAPASVTVQSTVPKKKLEDNLPISVLLARAKEAYEIRQQSGNGWEREKARRAVREIEKSVQPDESIHPGELERIGIMEFKYVLGELGVFLRPDV